VALNFVFDFKLGARIDYLGLAVGVILLGSGALMLTSWTLNMEWVNRIVNRFSTTAGGASFSPRRNVFLYGIGYGAAATSCTAPIFLSLVLGSLVRGNWLESLLVFTIFSVTMGVLMVYFTMVVATARDSLLTFFTRYSNAIKKFSGGILAIAGVYLIIFFLAAQGWWPWWFPNLSIL